VSPRPPGPTTDVEQLDALVVEDDQDNASLLLTRLAGIGVQADHVVTGEAALERCRRRTPAVLLLDLRLPGMDGVELLAQLDAEGLLSGTRVLVTSILPRGAVTAAVGGWVGEVLTKPYSTRQLAAALRRTTRTDDGTPAPCTPSSSPAPSAPVPLPVAVVAPHRTEARP
jgi:two-component system response regulator AdeR